MTWKAGMVVVKPIFILTVVCIAHHWSLPASAYELHSRRSDHVHRFKSFDRIRHRLDRHNQLASEKELLHPGLSTAYNSSNVFPPTNNNNGVDGRGTRGTRPQDSNRLSEPQDFSEIDSDDLDEEEDEDSYEDEEDEELLADKTSSWPPSWNGYSSYGKHNNYRSKLPSYPQTTTTTTTTTTAPPISYSQYKWQNLGTRQGVEQYRRNSIATSHRNYGGRHYNGRPSATVPDTPNQDAINHALRVLKEGNCGVPKPRLVRVQDFYPHPGITYVPHCTILHQCSDDTGCCRHEVLTCSPKSTQRVELAFYTYTSGTSRNSATTRLTFYNHTECECRDRMDDIMPRDMSSSPVGLKSGTSTAAASTGGHGLDPLTSYQYHSSSGDSKSRNPQCKCSSAFAERILPDGSCSCDCFDKQKECLRLKRGKDFFSMQDKWCIQTGRCEIPTCAYGPYIHLAGRCPRKKERFSPPLSWQRYLTQ